MRWALYVLAELGVWTVAGCIAGPLIGRYIASRSDEYGLIDAADVDTPTPCPEWANRNLRRLINEHHPHRTVDTRRGRCGKATT